MAVRSPDAVAKAKASKRRWNQENYDPLDNVKRYGITKQQFLDMSAAQNGRCKVCGRPPSDGYKRLSVDHDHKTKRVRGLLCNRCNLAIGHAQESPERLRALAAYLER